MPDFWRHFLVGTRIAALVPILLSIIICWVFSQVESYMRMAGSTGSTGTSQHSHWSDMVIVNVLILLVSIWSSGAKENVKKSLFHNTKLEILHIFRTSYFLAWKLCYFYRQCLSKVYIENVSTVVIIFFSFFMNCISLLVSEIFQKVHQCFLYDHFCI